MNHFISATFLPAIFWLAAAQAALFVAPAFVADDQATEEKVEAAVVASGGRIVRNLKLATAPIVEAYLKGETASDQLLKDLNSCKELHTVALFQTSITANGVKVLSIYPKLSDVRISDHEIKKGGLKHLAAIPKLERFGAGPGELTDNDLGEIAKLTKLNHISLVLTGVQAPVITGKGLSQLAAIENLKSLTIHAKERGITDEFVAGMSQIKSLETLKLMDTALTDKGIKAMTKLTNLRALYLYSSYLTNNGLETFLEMPQLRILLLTGGQHTAGGIKDLRTKAPKLQIIGR
jgi:hypothetical protein